MTNYLRTPILRQPGQSLDEQLAKMDDDDFAPIAAIIVLFIMLAVLEWVRWIFPLGPQPWLATASALGVLWWGIRRSRMLRAARERMRLGRDGERMVAQTIEPLAADGCLMLHDIPGDGFNLDHVIIGPKGVFVVETKTRSRAKSKSKSMISLINGAIHLNGIPEQGDSLGQAQAAAKWLEDLLRRLLGESIAVQPVVAFPEWYVDIDKPYDRPVWVVNPKVLLTFVPNAKGRLSPSLVGRIHHALVEHVTIRQTLTQQFPVR